ncbi:hypothetical protein MMC19_000252 [Ptychographa xylographoides]|nr:hypothetical protein [Ptychographa xylographoides]
MARLTSALLFSLFASLAVAAPKHTHTHHKKKPCPTGTGVPYSTGNSTWYGPTGTAAGTVPIIYSTVLVSPLPLSTPLASGNDGAVPASTASIGAGSLPNKGVSISSSGSQCGPPTITVTASNTVTVTVAGSSLNAAASVSSSVPSLSSSLSVPYGLANSTAYGPTGPTAYSTYGTAPVSSSAAPVAVSTGKDAPYHNTWTAPLVNPYSAPSSVSSSSSSVAAVAAPSTISATSVVAYVPPPSSSSSSSTKAAYTPPAPAPPPTTKSTSTIATYTPPAASSTSTTAAVVPPTQPAPAPVAPSTTSGSSSNSPPSGAKRGVVYNTASLCAPFASQTAIGWGYNWGASPSGLPSSLNYVPMLWGLNGQQDSFVAQTKASLANLAAADRSIMGFNEPDEASQYGGSALSPPDAAAGWITYMQPFAGTARLGAPAVTNANSTSPLMGIPWLQAFDTACAGKCVYDFVPCHWYGWDGGSAQAQATALQTYLHAVYAAVGKPLWLTEFSAMPLGDQATNTAFLDIMLPWLDGQGFVERYSFFMVTDGYLVQGSDPATLTQMGEAYLSS